MSDDLKNRGPQDRARIDVNEEHELRYWSEQLGVSKEALKQAVREVGPMAAAVREKLGKA